eukprot:scaffold87806_cov63-Phaeocystis_antarctica.AAC.5
MWRDELVSAADLQTTDLERLRAPEIYLHHQNAGAAMEPGSDDHHSPIKPDQYISLRLEKMMSWVIGVTSLAGAVVSWSEFSETERKIERYTRAVRSIKKVLSWWDVLTDVEKAGADNITTLIETGESIIADERQAWQSTANRLAAARGGPEVAAGAQPPSASASGEPERRAAVASSSLAA